MATASVPHRWTYNVFVSFRGEDIRKSFMDHLFKDFWQKGIHAFRDDNQFPRGEEISSQLYKAIEESRFLIVIFSKNYASSSWCLRELVKILECKQMGQHKHDIQVIFYDVKPDVVKKQTGSYAEAFAKHEFSNRTEVAKWKEALSTAANISGWDLQDMANGYESKLIESITKEILEKLCDGPLHVGENLVGVNSRIEKMNLLRFVGTSKVHMIGICGMSGIGKTTFAKAIYNMMYSHFEECIFCDDVQGATKRHGLTQVVKELIQDITKARDVNISNISQGVMVMKQRMTSKQILLVLDGVSHPTHLEVLAGSCDWFSPGSLIIFTSQDKQLLRSHKVEEIFDMEFLDDDEALELFSLYAFSKKHPTEEFEELACQVVQYVQGHPLALKVLGRFLYDKTLGTWKSELERLQTYPNAEIQQVLRLGFDGLDLVQKAMLLDIACYLIGENKDFAASVLDSCGFFAQSNMQVLHDKSLITISSTMSLQMHGLIQGMAREIIREESKRPADQSRLWILLEVCDVLNKNKVTEAVEVLVLLLEKSSQQVHIDVKAFAYMKKLRILKVCDLELKDFGQTSKLNFSGSLEFLSNELRLFYWYGCPFKFLPSDFYPENIVVVDMSYSHIKTLWTAPKCFRRLKVMKLTHCRNLSSTPDFTEIANLEELIFEGCVNLVKVHPSIGMLKRLVVLNMRNCTRLTSFPCKVKMDSLQVLILSGCSKLEKLPEVLGTIKTLMELHVDLTSIKELPSFVFSLSNLQVLSIGRQGRSQSRWGNSIFWPSWLQSKFQQPQSLLWPSLASLHFLRQLNVSSCNISEVSPDSIGGLSCLEYLNLSGNNFTCLPASVIQLSQLKSLVLFNCQKLEVLPVIPPGVIWFEWSSLCYPSVSHLIQKNLLDCTSSRQLQKLPVTPISFIRHFFLFGFHKLVENLTIECLVPMLLTQGFNYLSHPLDILFQGNIIPLCFTNQNTGKNVKVELPRDWCYTKFRGYGTCVVLTPIKSYSSEDEHHRPRYLVENFDGAVLDRASLLRVTRPMVETMRTTGSDVMWFHYSKCKWCWKEVKNFVTFSFEGNGVVEVKACGVRLVCDEEDIFEEEMWEWIAGTIEDEPPVKKSRTV